MKALREIYSEYKIMPSLQLHQLRVASVGGLICESLSVPINKNDVILAGLFHDMGNIIKSDLAYFPDFIEPEGTEYWQKVKDEYISEYGNDSHKAMEMIAREIGLSENVLEIIDNIGFSNAEEVRSYGSWELKVCIYSDWRVGPRGVLTMKERLDEARRRYAERNMGDIIKSSEEEFIKLLNACVAIEKQLEEVGFHPEDATDERIAPIMKNLWDFAL
ncbi:MAG: HD domain-containing protein [Candidatus Kaiserbacteria bacterium]|nr:HD domain-containing protein [Candidatus Kaiserbacteria bacterium]